MRRRLLTICTVLVGAALVAAPGSDRAPEPSRAESGERRADVAPAKRTIAKVQPRRQRYSPPPEAIRAARDDARRLPAGMVREATRYLTSYNVPLAMRGILDSSLRYRNNSISKRSELVAPRLVCPDLYAVIVHDYGWDPRTWEKLADVDPYFHVQVVTEEVVVRKGDKGQQVREKRTVRKGLPAPRLPQAEYAELQLLVVSAAPIVRADWWFVQASRQLSLNDQQTGVGYYDWLQLKDRAAFEDLIGLDAKGSIRRGRDMRFAIDRSGVSAHNRQGERLQAVTGARWMTLDTDSNIDVANAVRLLARGDYRHKAEEHFGALPCGLWGFFLCQADGTRQNSAPDFIGGDTSPLRAGNDIRIHIGIACERCHVSGLQQVDCWARRTLRAPNRLQSPIYDVLLTLRTQYMSDLPDQIEEDNRLFRKALKRCNGLTPEQNAKAVADLWNWYALRPRGPEDIAIELGVPTGEFLRALQCESDAKRGGSGIVDHALAGLLKTPPDPIRVEYLEEVYPLLQELLHKHRVRWPWEA